MRRIVIGAVAAALAALSLSTTVEARSVWHHGWHHGWHHRGWHRGHWYHGRWHRGYWGPRIVIGVAPGPCYIKKIRHYRHGHLAYVTRVRVCE